MQLQLYYRNTLILVCELSFYIFLYKFTFSAPVLIFPSSLEAICWNINRKVSENTSIYKVPTNIDPIGDFQAFLWMEVTQLPAQHIQVKAASWFVEKFIHNSHTVVWSAVSSPRWPGRCTVPSLNISGRIYHSSPGGPAEARRHSDYCPSSGDRTTATLSQQLRKSLFANIFIPLFRTGFQHWIDNL